MSFTALSGPAAIRFCCQYSGQPRSQTALIRSLVSIDKCAIAQIARLSLLSDFQVPHGSNYLEILLDNGIYLEGSIGMVQPQDRGNVILFSIEYHENLDMPRSRA